MNNQKAIVWDLDGVIVDSGDTHNNSWVEMARHYDLPYSAENDFPLIFGRHNNDIIATLWGVTDPKKQAEMALYKEEAFRVTARELSPLPGVARLMKAIRDAGWRQGIGSSAPLENVQLLLEVTGLSGYMEVISSGEDVKVGKPDPMVFRVAFERLGVDPSNGIVVEDAPAGVQGAKAAGARCLAVTNTQPEAKLIEAGADRVVASLEEVGMRDLEQLLQG